MTRTVAIAVAALFLAMFWLSGSQADASAPAPPNGASTTAVTPAVVRAAPHAHHHHHHDEGGHHHDHEEPDGCHHDCGTCCVGHAPPVGVNAAASRPVIEHTSPTELCVSARVPDGPEGAAPFQVPKA